ncbi:MAG: hypothetical protein ACXAC7_10005, partial [Candidatus Hodarchaeales archaeon]
MFCNKCGAIIGRKRTPNGVVEFCRCPDRLEKDIVILDIPKRSNNRVSLSKTYKSSNKGRKRAGRSVESINIPKQTRPNSEYNNLPLDLQILTSKARLPPGWNQGKIGQMLQKALFETYERFYRKFEDFFLKINSELRFIVLLKPTATMNEFNVVLWGVGTLQKDSNDI